MTSLVTINRISKSFGKKKALISLSATVENGTVTAIAGPNGSGKTTLIRLMAKLIAPDEGEILYSSKHVKIGLLLEHRHLYPRLTAQENLELFRLLQGGKKSTSGKLMETFSLDLLKDQLVETLSRGEKQRVAIVRALQSEPDLLLLDEPFSGIDAATKSLLVEELQSIQKRGAAVVIASHRFNTLHKIAEKALLLESGVLRYRGDWDPEADLETSII